MGDNRVTSSDFVGTCDGGSGFWGNLLHPFSSGACTGVQPDQPGEFADVQSLMRDAGDTAASGDVDAANNLLDSLISQLGTATGSADPSLAAQAAASIVQAQNAIGVARGAIASGGDYSAQLQDASAKTAIAMNMLGAGAKTLKFAAQQLGADITNGLADVGSSVWNLVGYVLVGAVVVVAIVYAVKS